MVQYNTRLERAEIVALQAILGSDEKREALNLMRVISMRRNAVTPYWERRWNILFNGKAGENV